MRTILVVDDEKKILSLYGKMLCREGFNVLKAEDAEKAHELLLNNHVDLILLDINLSVVNGDLLFKVIEEFFKNTSVIVTSVHSVEYQQSLIPEAVDYYDKSACTNELIEKVKAVFADRENGTQGLFKEKKQAQSGYLTP